MQDLDKREGKFGKDQVEEEKRFWGGINGGIYGSERIQRSQGEEEGG